MTPEQMESLADMIATRLMGTFAARLDMIEEVVFSGLVTDTPATKEDDGHCGELLKRWYFTFSDRSIQIKDVIYEVDNDPESNFSIMVKQVVTAQGVFTGRFFGGWLRRHKNKIVNGFMLEAGSHSKREPGWRVIMVRK